MRIIFVRHGHPNYEKDCLTELGHLHAEAAAERLADEGIEKIFASSCGRAYETAEHIARKCGLQVEEKLDFMRELDFTPTANLSEWQKYNPWGAVKDMANQGQDLLAKDWAITEPFCYSKSSPMALKVGEDFDRFLETLGYTREGAYYRVGKPKYNTIAMVSHGGSSSGVLAHLLNLTYPYICSTLSPDFTAVTIIRFTGDEGRLIAPEIEIANDSRHIKGITL